MPIRQLKEWWNSPPVKDEPSMQGTTSRPSQPTTEQESKRLDDELIKAKEGKTHDLRVYGYIKGPKALVIPLTSSISPDASTDHLTWA